MKVIALEVGFDNVALRSPGDIFEMPDNSFDRRPRLNANGEPIKDAFYDPPSWFEPVDPALKARVEKERKEVRKTAGLAAIDPARQSADQIADHHLRAAAQAQVEQEDAAADESDKNKRIEAKLGELRKAAGLKAPSDQKK